MQVRFEIVATLGRSARTLGNRFLLLGDDRPCCEHIRDNKWQRLTLGRARSLDLDRELQARTLYFLLERAHADRWLIRLMRIGIRECPGS